MDRYRNTCPLSQQQLIEEYFIEYRAFVLAIAAYLDRLDRSTDRNAETEFRYTAFRKALHELVSDEPGRAERVQMILSDPNVTLLEERDRQGAFGAFDTSRLSSIEGGDGR